ncbi:MAG: hypothetical protein ACLP6G_12685 [Terriglobales bacterium]
MNLSEYAESLKSSGYRVLDGSGATIWVSHGRFAMQRQPVFALHVPTRDETREVFKRSRVPLLSFVVSPTDQWPANSCLYLCRDREYSLEKLGKGPRYDVRRGLSEFEITFLEPAELLQSGAQAYCDTLARTRLSGGTPEGFKALFSHPRRDRKYLGALRGDRLAAFLMITEVDGWISIGGYSANEFLPLRPNNGLVFYAVRHYLVERKFRVVSYGLSSIQAVSNEAGLEKFKLKMGFESIPVHRAFVVHPLLRPFVNRGSWGLAKAMLRLSPQSMMLKKAEGALRMAMREYKS